MLAGTKSEQLCLCLNDIFKQNIKVEIFIDSGLQQKNPGQTFCRWILDSAIFSIKGNFFLNKQRILLIQYNYFVMFKGPQFEKTDRIHTKSQDFNQSVIEEMASLTNSYFPFHSEQPPFPYHYPFPFSFPPPYTYFSNPYCPPYSNPSYQQQPSNLNPLLPSAFIKPIKDEQIESLSQICVKAQASEAIQLEAKSLQENSIPAQKKLDLQRVVQRRQSYNKKKKPAVNLQVKQIFKKLLKSFLSQQLDLAQRIETKKQLKKIDNQASDIFFDNLYENLRKKFADFKKTKEQLIKYIIRRTYHNYKLSKGSDYKPELDRLQQFHQRNLLVYKSMNTEFLKKEFSNKLFVEIYKEFLGQMDEQFERENQQRIQRLAHLLSAAWAQKNMKFVFHEKKIPWNTIYKRKVKMIALDLLKQFQGETLQLKCQEAK